MTVFVLSMHLYSHNSEGVSTHKQVDSMPNPNPNTTTHKQVDSVPNPNTNLYPLTSRLMTCSTLTLAYTTHKQVDGVP